MSASLSPPTTEGHLGSETCGWEGRKHNRCLFLLRSSTFSEHELVAWVSRKPKKQALQGELSCDEGLVADMQMLALLLLCSTDVFFPMVRGPLPRVASASWPLTLSSEALAHVARLAPTPIWGIRSTLPTGRLVSVHLPCQLLEAEAVPKISFTIVNHSLFSEVLLVPVLPPNSRSSSSSSPGPSSFILS